MIAAIVLAAGSSSRFGRPKALLPFRGSTLIGTAIDAALAGGCDPVLVVLGAAADEVQASLAGRVVIPLHNPEWAEGMASSIRTGVQALVLRSPQPDGALLLTCDQPLLTADLVRELRRRFESGGGRIVACEYAGTVGIPALFGRLRFDDLLELRGPRGAKSVLERDLAEVERMAWPDGAVDIDRPEEYARWS